MVTMKYDSYYKKEIPYTMTLEDLFKRAAQYGGKFFHYSEEDVLAYIRYICIDNALFYMSTELPQDIMDFGGVVLSSGRSGKAPCRIVPVEEDLYNPLIEKDSLHEGHWYHPYKIKLTPVDFNGCIDSWYFMDFVSAINGGNIEIWERSKET